MKNYVTKETVAELCYGRVPDDLMDDIMDLEPEFDTDAVIDELEQYVYNDGCPDDDRESCDSDPDYCECAACAFAKAAAIIRSAGTEK